MLASMRRFTICPGAGAEDDRRADGEKTERSSPQGGKKKTTSETRTREINFVLVFLADAEARSTGAVLFILSS